MTLYVKSVRYRHLNVKDGLSWLVDHTEENNIKKKQDMVQIKFSC